MRMLPYAKRIMARRLAEDDYWLAIVALGWLRDADILSGHPGIARLGCPADVDPAGADWRVITGMDVLCVPFAPAPDAFLHSVWAAIWRARPATLWLADGRGHAGRIYATMLCGRIEFVQWSPARVRLDASYRAEVELVRRIAFETGAAPLYCNPEFAAARRSGTEHAAPA